MKPDYDRFQDFLIEYENKRDEISDLREDKGRKESKVESLTEQIEELESIQEKIEEGSKELDQLTSNIEIRSILNCFGGILERAVRKCYRVMEVKRKMINQLKWN